MSVFESRILGINARNVEYIAPANPRVAMRLADNKLLAKDVLKKAGVPVAQTYAVLASRRAVRDFPWESLPKSFVIKPNAGLGGGGILIIFGKRKDAPGVWIQADHTPIGVPELQDHVYNILDGMYSFDSAPDVAFIEERVKIHPVLKPYSYRGIPDIRVIVYNKVPVMAMLRLPTKESRGKANLALGGLGVGIDIASGLTTHAIVGKGKRVSLVPDERLLLAGVQIPCWQKILALAVECQLATGLGYLGVDVALDKETGPKVLEINARPGLSIQLANLAPLRDRLQRLKGLTVETLEKGVTIGQSLFTQEIPESFGALAGRRVAGVFEPITIVLPSKKEHNLMAKLDTGAYSSSIDRALAEKLGLAKNVAYEKKVKSALGEETRSYVHFSFKLKGELIETAASLADRSESTYDVLIGRRDLGGFIIDPSRKRPTDKAT